LMMMTCSSSSQFCRYVAHTHAMHCIAKGLHSFNPSHVF
jgi:hypothetical protein